MISYDNKDKTLPTSNPRRIWRDVDANEVKTVVNDNEDTMLRILRKGTTSGTNNYTASTNPIVGSYTDQENFQIKFSTDSTGLCTLDLGPGAKKLYKSPTVQADNGDIPTGHISIVVYDSALDSGNGGFLMVGGDGSVPDASESTKGIAALATQAETTTGTDNERIVTPLKLHTKVVGVQDIFIPASAMWPRATNGASGLSQTEIATSMVNIQAINFDQATQEFAQFMFALPRKWNNDTITAEVYWTSVEGSGGVVFEISGGAYSNDDALSAALGSPQSISDTLLTADDLHITPTSSPITLAGLPSSSDFLVFQLSRNPSNGSDTLTADAKVLGIMLHVITTAAKDA